jgi:hypothetical protein
MCLRYRILALRCYRKIVLLLNAVFFVNTRQSPVIRQEKLIKSNEKIKIVRCSCLLLQAVCKFTSPCKGKKIEKPKSDKPFVLADETTQF